MIDRNEFCYAWLRTGLTGSLDTGNPFLRLVAVWMAFNAVYEGYRRRGMSEWDAIEHYISAEHFDAHHQSLLRHDGYVKAVQILAESGVEDDRTGVIRHIASANELNQVIRCISQVRCNLLHGGKHPEDCRDRDLCYASYVIIASLLLWRTEEKLIPELN